MLTGDDSNETVELAYQAWYQKQAENEVLNAEVTVGEVQGKSRKDYDVGNELSGFSNMEVGDIDLEDYEDQITESVGDEVIEAIRESVNDNMPISDGDSETSHVNVDTELEITVPISGDIDFDWTVNENYHEEVEDSDWNAESVSFHGENYQNHLKMVKKSSYSRKYAEDSPSPSSPLEEVPATVPSPAEPTNESFNAEDDMVICGGCEQERYSDSEFSIDNARSDVLDDGNVLCDYCWDDNYNAEMDELDDSSSIIRNQVGDMVGMVELDENDEDIEKVDVDIIDDDGEMAYEGTLGAETFEAKEISRSRYQFTLDDWPIRIHVENCPMNPHAKRDGVYTPKEIAQKSYTVLYNHESLPQFEGNTFGELRKASNGLVVPCNCTINEMKVVKELDPATFTREPDETQEHWDAESEGLYSKGEMEEFAKMKKERGKSTDPKQCSNCGGTTRWPVGEYVVCITCMKPLYSLSGKEYADAQPHWTGRKSWRNQFNAENDSWDGTTGDDFRKYDDMELTESDHEAILEEIESGLENFGGWGEKA